MVEGDQAQQAKELYEAQRFAEAGALYHALWDKQGDAFSGGRYAHCLRKCGHAQAAVAIGRQVAEQHPEDIYVRRELVWALYDAQVKPAKERADLGALVHAAEQIVGLTKEDLPVRLVVFTVIDVAKARGKWDIVSAWCDRIDPQSLSLEKREVGGRRILSEREQWFYAKIKALIQLEQWSEARRLTETTNQLFPRNIHFRRWAAQARAGEGNLPGAIQELEDLLAQGASDWFILADLAQMQFALGQLEDALRTACRAALAPSEDKAKVNLFVLLARIGLAMKQPEFAVRNIALTKAVRMREGWPIKNNLLALEQQINAALSDGESLQIPTDAAKLLKICQSEWREKAILGQKRYSGQICNLSQNKKFGFITPDDGDENIFVLVRDLPLAARSVGARVEFGLETSFDHKKNRESLRAVDIQVIK